MQSALKEVNTQIKNTQSQLKDVEKFLKLDPSNMEQLAQKQRLLTDAIKETKEKLETEVKLKSLETQAATTNATLAKIEEVGGKFQSVGDRISGVGTKLTTSVTVPLVAAGTAAVKTAADFEYQRIQRKLLMADIEKVVM